jgi:hypothetical protein
MRCLLLSILFFGITSTTYAEPISFNKHIRPILADRCYACHGPDSATRKAGLHLGLEVVSKSKLEDSGNIAIVPGKPDASELLTRLTDSEQLMPPPESKLKVSKDEIALIRQWIVEGAKWERHWAFIPPAKGNLPAVTNSKWPRNEIDRFILHRLESEKLQPTRPATKERWLRRVTFDLTGLPPTLKELDAFLADKSEQAARKVVDRLLKSPAFGERMALEWLDVARYGDTDGLFEDHPRSLFPWRDWVVSAFNNNLPYNDFISWQLAGDLLPNATITQRIATGFIRNNPTSNEGGIVGEDYRIKYLVDRVNTTATSMLGLTLECAQCHDHKFDPMTQREYYQFAGFFNSLVGNGNTKGATAPTLRNYTAEQAGRIKAVDVELAQLDATLKSTPAKLTADFGEWLKKLEQPVRWKTPKLVAHKSLKTEADWLIPVTLESPKNTLPKTLPKQAAKRGRYVRIALKKRQVGFLTLSEVEVFSGKQNIALTGKATQSSVGFRSPAAKAIDGNHNGSFASCSCTNEEQDTWWEVDLGTSFPINSVVVWNRTDCCPERLDNVSIQVLDESRKIVAERKLAKAAARNTLPADAKPVDLKSRTLTFRLQFAASTVAALQWESRQPAVVQIVKASFVKDGKASDLKFIGDANLKLTKKPLILALATPAQLTEGQHLELTIRTAALNGFRVATTDDPTASLRATLPKERNKRHAHFRNQWPGFADARGRRKTLVDEKKKIEATAPLSMIAADLASPRTNYVLIRGEYDRRGKTVETAAMSSIMTYAEELPKNRLGLARWLTHRDHPLTARVAVNRYWQIIFGVGIVKTSEDFGTQGDRPSHQELLDWLAVDFVQSDWDVKSLIRKIVLSATYRQASVQTRQIAAQDPENRLLSHVQRRRLQSEFVRDHALATSGLLVNKRGGPGVNPYQPAELFGANAIGSSRAKFTQSTGDGLFRRSLYTYWKRQIPAANMRILGADGRTKCRTRRELTNTPLQALVLLNDPQFVEAARALAERSIRNGGDSVERRLAFAFRLATSRHAKPAEITILRQEYRDRLKEFHANPKAANAYLAGGGVRKPAADINSAELAAYAAVCSLILNLDESISLS